MKWLKRLYERMFAELFLFFHQNRERYADWQAVVIYPNRATEQEEVRPYRHLLESEQVHRVYLDELGNIRQLSIGMALMVLTIVGEREAPEEARYLLERAEREVADPVSRQTIMEMVTRIMSYKFSRKNLREIEAMLGIRFEETRVYREIREEGETRGQRSLIVRQLNQKFKSLPDPLVQRVNTLDLEQLERLAIALLNFKKMADLEKWLSQPENQPRPVQEAEERAEPQENDREPEI